MSNRIPGLGKIGLGPVEMVLQSVYDSMHDNEGEPPLRIELHPAVMTSFCEDYRRNYAGHEGAGVILELLKVVPIVPGTHVDRPRLVERGGGIRYM